MEIREDEPSQSLHPLLSSSGHFKLFNQMELLEFKDKYIVRALDFDSSRQGFSISRFNGDIQPLSSDDSPGTPDKTSMIFGVVGTIRLVAGMHILVITSTKEVGKYLSFPIFRVQSIRYLPCYQALQQLSPKEKKDEAYFRNLLRVVESTPGLYYSYETDITLNLQRRLNLVEGWMSKPLWKQADPRFVWNRALLDELVES